MNTHPTKQIRQTLKEKISEAKISVHALEKKAGLKPSAVQNILYGKSKKPSFHIMQSIAQALNCTVSELTEEENDIASIPIVNQENKNHSHSTRLWNPDLYVETFNVVNFLSKKKNFFLSKEKMFDCAEEIYEYSLKNNKTKPDKHFADWLLEKTQFSNR